MLGQPIRTAVAIPSNITPTIRTTSPAPGRGNTVGTLDPNPYRMHNSLMDCVRKYPAKHVLYQQGDYADSVFYIQEGRVKLSVVSNLGREAVVALMGPNTFFGENCLADANNRRYTATTLQRCKITEISKHEMVEILARNPKYADLFMGYLLTRNGQLQEDLIDQLFNSSEKRLARLLLMLAYYSDSDQSGCVIKKISQETLAMMIGTTRSRVSLFMNKFRRLGMLEYDKEIRINREQLSTVLREN